jgi:hypothetical protein
MECLELYVKGMAEDIGVIFLDIWRIAKYLKALGMFPNSTHYNKESRVKITI